MTLRRFVLRQLTLMLVTLFIISALTFFLIEFVPGDLARTILGPFSTNHQVAVLRQQLGLDRPLLQRYLDWLGHFVIGDWGESRTQGVQVLPLVMGRLWNSIQLGALAMLITVPLSVGFGILAALHRDKLLDRTINVIGLTWVGIPEFASGIVLLFVFSLKLRWFPVIAEFDPSAGPLTRLHHLLLPAIPLVMVLFVYIARHTRQGTIDVLDSPYVRTAILKGLPRRRVIIRHVLPNALLPAVSVIGLQTGFVLGGLVIIENLFTYPGIGQLSLQAATLKDVDVLLPATMVTGIIFMLVRFATELLYGLLDPRIRLGRK
jgi:peptide/nickel transport system permease protein